MARYTDMAATQATSLDRDLTDKAVLGILLGHGPLNPFTE